MGAGLGGDLDGIGSVDADGLLDRLPGPFDIRRGKVDLVDHGQQIETGIHGQPGIGHRLGLDPLAGVDEQQGPFAGAQAAAHLIAEVDMARGVDEVDDVLPAIGRGIVQAHGLGLDGDAALALDIHGVEHLAAHLARVEATAELDEAVGQGGLAVVDMGDDRDVADAACWDHVREGPAGAEHRRGVDRGATGARTRPAPGHGARAVRSRVAPSSFRSPRGDRENRPPSARAQVGCPLGAARAPGTARSRFGALGPSVQRATRDADRGGGIGGAQALAPGALPATDGRAAPRVICRGRPKVCMGVLLHADVQHQQRRRPPTLYQEEGMPPRLTYV